MSKLGARDVNLVYRRGFEEMGATAHEQDIAKANQVRLLTWAQPDAVLLNDQGQVRGMRFARTRLENGRLQSTGQTFELAADAIFTAIGQAFDGQALNDPLARELKREGERIWSTPSCKPACQACMPAATAPPWARTSPYKPCSTASWPPRPSTLT